MIMDESPGKLTILINAVSARLGGGVTFVDRLAAALVKSGNRVQVRILCRPDMVGYFSRGQNHSLEVEAVPAASGSVIRRILWEQFELPRRPEAVDPDAVLLSPGNVAAFRWRGPQIVLVQSIAPLDAQHRRRGGISRRLRYATLYQLGRRSFKCASAVVVNSRASAKLAKAAGCPVARIHTIPLGHDPSFRALSTEPTNESYLLVVGSAYRHKNLPTLLRAIALLRDRGAALPLRIVGSWPEPEYMQEISDLADQLGLGSMIQIHGPVPYDTLPAIYSGASCYVLASRLENFPHTLLEAMGSGCPVVAGRQIPTEEICGEAAQLCDVEDPASIADAIEAVIRYPERAQELRAAGFQRISQFAWSAIADRYLALIRTVTERAQPIHR